MICRSLSLLELSVFAANGSTASVNRKLITFQRTQGECASLGIERSMSGSGLHTRNSTIWQIPVRHARSLDIAGVTCLKSIAVMLKVSLGSWHMSDAVITTSEPAKEQRRWRRQTSVINFIIFLFHALCRVQRKYTLDNSFAPPMTITTFYNPDAQEVKSSSSMILSYNIPKHYADTLYKM